MSWLIHDITCSADEDIYWSCLVGSFKCGIKIKVMSFSCFQTKKQSAKEEEVKSAKVQEEIEGGHFS